MTSATHDGRRSPRVSVVECAVFTALLEGDARYKQRNGGEGHASGSGAKAPQSKTLARGWGEPLRARRLRLATRIARARSAAFTPQSCGWVKERRGFTTSSCRVKLLRPQGRAPAAVRRLTALPALGTIQRAHFFFPALRVSKARQNSSAVTCQPFCVE